ncbi:hypothetical protein [Actinomadura opuntiae]|uniref:hypothetical protein n=1 Tax=Actinomadura sp. OS1-43 TaxID=604315 RepID=UPI00255B3BA2|nr:hypothetical protein [Actinomadura sp. OS1-43]MDL4815977.1 hypothetical protein [Actinomadura sp. OS1-43]
MRSRSLMTRDIEVYADALFDTARKNALTTDHTTECLLMLNARARRKLVTSVGAGALCDSPDAVKQAIDEYRAVALVHVARYRVTWVRDTVAAGLFPAPPQGEPRKLIAVEGYWPAKGFTYLRMAQVLEAGGIRDVIELDTPDVTAGSWLQDLLPHR